VSYLLSTDTLLGQATHEDAFPGGGAAPEEHEAAKAARSWAEQIQSDLTYLSVLTLGELRIMRNGARRNLTLLYQLDALLDRVTGAWDRRILDITKQDMYHWARIYDSMDQDPDMAIEDTFVISQALTHGLTYVGRRSSTIDALESIGLAFVDPIEWTKQKSPP
jgi:predicted nucleic acid-binding protein